MSNTQKEAINDTQRLFVYGTLKQNFRNHNYLTNANYLGKIALEGLALINYPSYPFAMQMEGSRAVGEVYELDRFTLSQIDDLEEYNPKNPNSLYQRKRISTENYGDVWVYLLPGESHASQMVSQYGIVDEWFDPKQKSEAQ